MNHILVTGGAGFLGAHLCRALLDRGDRVTAIDNFSSGRPAAVAPLTDHPRFTLRTADITDIGAFADLEALTHIAHLARPGSPVRAARHPAATLHTAVTGTLAALDLAAAHEARIVLVSGTDPDEMIWCGAGLRAAVPSVHSTGNLLVESVARRYRISNTGIVRPFEVYGPGLRPGDGRAPARICAAALRDQTLYLTENDTRAYVYVTDTIAGIIAMLHTETPGPIDLAGPTASLADFARTACTLAGTGWLETTTTPATRHIRAPDLAHTRTRIGWQPTTALHTGIHHTLDWMRTILSPRDTVG